jgi:hypothetical protein
MVLCTNVTIVIKYLIQKKTCMNIQKFIQIVKEPTKSKIDRINQIKIRLKKLLKKNRVIVRINQIKMKI